MKHSFGVVISLVISWSSLKAQESPPTRDDDKKTYSLKYDLRGKTHSVPPVPAAGLHEQSTSGRFKESFGRASGKVRRPCHNCGSGGKNPEMTMEQVCRALNQRCGVWLAKDRKSVV